MIRTLMYNTMQEVPQVVGPGYSESLFRANRYKNLPDIKHIYYNGSQRKFVTLFKIELNFFD